VQTVLGRPIEGEWLCGRLAATDVEARRDHPIVPVAVIVAVGVNTDGRREGLGMTVGHSEAEPFRVEFPRPLARRGSRGAKRVVSDAHAGLKAAIVKILGATRQRCRVPFMRDALADAGTTRRRVVPARVGTALARHDPAAARTHGREVADRARPRVPRLAALMDDAEADVLASRGFPVRHRAGLHGTDPLGRLNGEIERRSEVVGIVPNEAAVIRLIGASPLEQNDDCALRRARSMSPETIAPLRHPPIVGSPTVAARASSRSCAEGAAPAPRRGTGSRAAAWPGFPVTRPTPRRIAAGRAHAQGVRSAVERCPIRGPIVDGAAGRPIGGLHRVGDPVDVTDKGRPVRRAVKHARPPSVQRSRRDAATRAAAGSVGSVRARRGAARPGGGPPGTRDAARRAYAVRSEGPARCGPTGPGPSASRRA